MTKTWQTRIRWLVPLVLFGAGFLLAAYLLSSTAGFVGTDDYYHSRVASQILAQRNLRLDFPWLPLTILAPQHFVDHHLLYHLYLAPWVYWGGITGAKLAQAVVVGGIVVVFWALLRSLQVRFALIWTLGIAATSSTFLYRMLMIRTQAAAVLIILITLYLLFQRRYRWLALCTFAFTWLYNGFILLPVIIGLYTAAEAITERHLAWKPIAYALVGMALGLIVNPYFPQNISFIIEHLGEKVDINRSIRVGNEWYPYDTDVLLRNAFGAMLAMAAGVLAPSFRHKRRDRVETTLLLIALLTLYMVFRSRRFIEYYPPFALLFCAAAWGRSRFSRPQIPRQRSLKPLYGVFFLLPVLLLAAATVRSTGADIRDAKSADYMQGAAAWLRANTEAGTLIFQLDWDDFPYLFFHNTQNAYLVGLDPTYLQLASPDLWNLWVSITQGRVEQPSGFILNTYGAPYVVGDRQHDAFADQAANDPNMQIVYLDQYSVIWQVNTSD